MGACRPCAARGPGRLPPTLSACRLHPRPNKPCQEPNPAALALLQRFVHNQREFDGTPSRDRLKFLPRVVNLDELLAIGMISSAPPLAVGGGGPGRRRVCCVCVCSKLLPRVVSADESAASRMASSEPWLRGGGLGARRRSQARLRAPGPTQPLTSPQPATRHPASHHPRDSRQATSTAC